VLKMINIDTENAGNKGRDAGILSYGLVENHITTRLPRVLKLTLTKHPYDIPYFWL